MNTYHRHRHIFHIVPIILISLIFVLNYFNTYASYYYLGQFGIAGSGDGELFYPNKITTDGSGNLYIADSSNNRVQKLDSNGNFISVLGSIGNGDGQFYNPKDVAIDSIGNIYVADADNNRIQKFDSSGNYVLQWGGFGTSNGQFIQPAAIAIDSSNNIYIAESGNDRIQKFDSTGNYISQFGSTGSGDGQFGYVNDIYIKDSYIYVAEDLNDRIQKFDLDGNYISQFGTGGSGDGQFSTPSGVVVDSNGDIIVSDLYNARVQIFNSSGVFQSKIGVYGNQILQFNNPTGVEFGNTDKVYVVDNNNHRVQILSLSQIVMPPSVPTSVTALARDGAAIVSFDASVFNGNSDIIYYTVTSNPGGITSTTTATSTTITGLTNGSDYTFTVTASNYSYTSSSSDPSNLVRPNPYYTFVTKFGQSGSGNGEFSNPFDADIDPYGNIYVTDDGMNRVQKFDNNGNYVSQFGTYGTSSGELAGPTGIKIKGGFIYVVDGGNSRVQKFDMSGNYISQFGLPRDEMNVGGNGRFYQPTFIDIDSQGNIYVADSGDNLIQKFDSTGNFITQFGDYGTGDGQTDYPTGIKVDSQDNIYVLDTNNKRVQKFSSSTEYISQFGSYGPGFNEFYNMQSIGLDKNGDLFVSHAHNESNIQAVKKYTPSYVYLTQIGSTQGIEDAYFNLPFAMTFDNNNDLFVVDRFNYRIQKFTLNAGAPQTVASAPQNVVAEAGNATATVSFSAPSSNGGSAISYYTILSTPGNIFATTTSVGSTTITGLTNDTAYTFVVNAVNGVGVGATSSPSNSVTPLAPTIVTTTTTNCPRGQFTNEDCLCPDGLPPTAVPSGTRIQKFTCERGGVLPVIIPPDPTHPGGDATLPVDIQEILIYESWPPQNQDLFKNNPKLKEILIQNSLFIKNYKFKKNLYYKGTDSDVRALQMFLNIRGYVLARSGPGSIGNETNYFGNATKQALIKFQKANKIYPANGNFGPVTREFVNKTLEVKN